MSCEVKGAPVRRDRLEMMLSREWFTSGLMFDNLLVVSNPGTNCLVLNTGDGLIVIDAILPCDEAFNAIRDGIADAGWDPGSVKKLVLTHGHFDHCGAGKRIVNAWHPRTYLSKRDDEFWRDEPAMPQLEWTLKDFDISDYVGDGDVISLGGSDIHVFSTPGHTPGGLSFIFDVYDRGERHAAALWGGTNPPADMEAIVQYMRSLDRFELICADFGVDVGLMNHPFLNDALAKLDFLKSGGAPNPFVLGRRGFTEFLHKFRELCYNRLGSMPLRD